MKGGIKGPLGQSMACQHLKLTGKNPGQMHPTGGDAQQQQILTAINTFQHLAGQALNRASQILSGQNFYPLGPGRGRHQAVAEATQCMGVAVSKS